MRKRRRKPSLDQVLSEVSEKKKQPKGLLSSWIESVPSKHVLLRAGEQRSRELGKQGPGSEREEGGM